MSDTLIYMGSMALIYGLMLIVAVSAAHDEWLAYPPELKRRRWRIFWMVTCLIFVVVETLCATGLVIIPLAVAGVIITVVVFGGFIAVLLGVGR